MIQTAIIIVLAACVAVMAWEVRKLTKDLKEESKKYRRLHEQLNATEEINIAFLRELTGRDMYVVGISIWEYNRICEVAIIKTFPYNPYDEADREYALLCAEELKEAIEYDWRIKE